MATRELTSESRPIDRVAGTIVSLLTLALMMGSVVALCAAVSP